jgi:hypothetical protein
LSPASRGGLLAASARPLIETSANNTPVQSKEQATYPRQISSATSSACSMWTSPAAYSYSQTGVLALFFYPQGDWETVRYVTGPRQLVRILQHAPRPFFPHCAQRIRCASASRVSNTCLDDPREFGLVAWAGIGGVAHVILDAAVTRAA